MDGSPVAATKALGHVALTYVVPADNSALAIEGVLSALASRLDGRDAEAIVVENGSTDGTGALRSAKGMGNAYRAGIAASRAARVVLTADDLPFGFDDLEAAEGVDPVVHPVVVGSKGHRDSDADRALLRGVLSRGFWALRRVVPGMRTLDPQGTFVLGATGRAGSIRSSPNRLPRDHGAVLPRRAPGSAAAGGAGAALPGAP